MTPEFDDDLIARHGCPWPWRIDWAAEGGGGDPDPSPQMWSAWREAVDPDNAGLFERRLHWDGLTPDSARRLLAQIPQESDPAWMTELAVLREAVRAGVGEEPATEVADLPFSQLIWPMVNAVWDRFAVASDVSAWSSDARAALRRHLGERVAEVAQHAFFADFSRTRSAGESLMARLGWAPTGTSAYRQWCADQARDGLTGLLLRFPVLGRLLSVTTTNWARTTAAMVTRVDRHRHELSDIFGIPIDSFVTAVFPGLSDSHRGGHSVAILEFADQRIVYKPKDLRIEHHFQRLVHSINEWFGDDAIHEVRVLPGDGPYGFTSHVAQQPCPPDLLPAFYQAAGRLMALLYLLGATDAHYENVIAHGPSVALVDPETLFHIDVSSSDRSELGDTVLRTGMLPTWIVAGQEQTAFDPSALGVTRLPGGTGRGWAHPNTDAMVWTRHPSRPEAPLSSPVAPDRPNPLPDHVEDLVRGFRQVCAGCREQKFREILLSALAGFRGLPQRVVLRDTRIYGLIAQRAVSADALTDANARAVELERLTRFALVGAERDPWWQVFRAELDDMENLDVPYFEHALGTDEVRGSRGPITGLVAESPLAQAEHRIRDMTAEHAAWQERLIRGAITARYLTADQPHPARATAGDAGWTGPYPIAGILDDIRAAALGTDPPKWVALMRLPDGRNVRLGLVGDDWYDGRTGIGAVQDQAADFMGDAGLAEQSRATTTPVREVLAHAHPYVRFRFLRNLGLGFTGIGGLLRWAHVTGEAALAEAIVDAVPLDLVTRDPHYDLIGGVAGLIGPLARLVRERPTPHARSLLTTAAAHLAAAQVEAGGWTSRLGLRPLTGYAHGAAGNGLALIEAGTACGEQRWIDAGAKALAYERSVFDAAVGNWPDFRERGEGPPMVAWCHGAAGIGLSRMRALQVLPDHPEAQRWHEDLRVAMRTTAEAEHTRTDHLCCGLTGRAAVLDIVGRATGEDRWIRAADRLTDVVLGDHARTGGFVLPMDADGQTVTPGLMTGLAGIAAHLMARQNGQDLAGFLL